MLSGVMFGVGSFQWYALGHRLLKLHLDSCRLFWLCLYGFLYRLFYLWYYLFRYSFHRHHRWWDRCLRFGITCHFCGYGWLTQELF
uniref:Uncharacterized protein n=1 Tax=Anopheles christyi TaxID=43041 RepID=A0A182KI71_9DIPT